MKNNLTVKILIDLALLIAMAFVSISGFILKVVIPSRHAIKHDGIEGWTSQLWGLGRHDWGDIHLWAGVILTFLLALHIILHWKMIGAFFKKKCPNSLLRAILYLFICIISLATFVPWLYLCC